MKRPLLVGAGLVCAGLLTRRCVRGHGGIDFEKMIERMPENAPPKWMFRNISAIRKSTERSWRNTERILELLEAERNRAAGVPLSTVP